MTRQAWRVLPVVAGVLLFGATLFGLWHLVVGGFINGNPRAAAFGVSLALVAGTALVVGVWVVRRHRRRVLAT